MVSPQLKMERVHFGSGIVHKLYERPIYKRTLPSDLLLRNLVCCEISTELEALKRITRINCSLKLKRYVKVTSNLIGEIQQCFWLTQQPYGRIKYFNRQLLGNNILALILYDWNYVFLLHPDCTYLSRTKILSMLGTASLLAEVSHFSSHFQLPRRERSLLSGKLLRTFWKSQKLIPSEKNQCVLVLKISFRKTEKNSPIRKNILPQKFRATRYTHLACFGPTIKNIGIIINHLFIVLQRFPKVRTSRPDYSRTNHFDNEICFLPRVFVETPSPSCMLFEIWLFWLDSLD